MRRHLPPCRRVYRRYGTGMAEGSVPYRTVPCLPFPSSVPSIFVAAAAAAYDVHVCVSTYLNENAHNAQSDPGLLRVRALRSE